MENRTPPARRIAFKGEVEYRREADDLTPAPGDSTLVVRGRPRSFVMACPDGCGEHLTINLDEQAGPTWSLYKGNRGMTLFPSVWRESGCRSHFIVWHDTILWCDWFTEGNREPDDRDPGLKDRVLELLDQTLQSYRDLAVKLGEIPWEVARACRLLKREGRAEEGAKPHKDHYRRKDAR